MTEPKTLLEAVRHFSDLKVCFAVMVKLKWPDGNVTCPRCGGSEAAMRELNAAMEEAERELAS